MSSPATTKNNGGRPPSNSLENVKMPSWSRHLALDTSGVVGLRLSGGGSSAGGTGNRSPKGDHSTTLAKSKQHRNSAPTNVFLPPGSSSVDVATAANQVSRRVSADQARIARTISNVSDGNSPRHDYDPWGSPTPHPPSPATPGQKPFLEVEGMDLSQLKVDSSSQILGSGHFGVVRLGVWGRTPVAVKYLGADRSFDDEIIALTRLRHPNIVQLLTFDSQRGALVMEFMNGGSLFKALHEQQSVPIPLAVRLKIAFDAASGIDFLHSMGYLHRDITSGNVLLSEHVESISSESPHALKPHARPLAKISDFGLARKGQTYQSGNTGNLYYCSPEVILGGPHSIASDVYSYGILLDELFSRCKPFQTLVPIDAANRASKGLRPDKSPLEVKQGGPSPTPREQIAPEIIQLASICWKQDPTERVNMKHVAEVLEGLLTSAIAPYRALVVLSSGAGPEGLVSSLQKQGLDVASSKDAGVGASTLRRFVEGARVVIVYIDRAGWKDVPTRQAVAFSIAACKHVFLVVPDTLNIADVLNYTSPKSDWASVAKALAVRHQQDQSFVFPWRARDYEREAIAARIAKLARETRMHSWSTADVKSAAAYDASFDEDF